MNKTLSREKGDLRYLKFCIIIFVKQSHNKTHWQRQTLDQKSDSCSTE